MDENRSVQTPNREKFINLVEAWANPPTFKLRTINEKTLDNVASGELYVVCFESIDIEHARQLDALFSNFEPYRGALEVIDSHLPHASLYTHGLSMRGRFYGKCIYEFWDGISEDSKDEGMLKFYNEFNFEQVEFESLQGRYTFFDKHHNPEDTIKAAEAKEFCSVLLSSVAERVLVHLRDSAPALPEKLYAAFKALKTAEDAEDFSHVAVSCRRIIEYCADQLFPPLNDDSERKLDKSAYRNRLLAYVDKERASSTSIDLIVASTKTVAEQLERLDSAINKGVHSELLDSEIRRCLIRTVMFLDDLVSLKTGPFSMKPKLDFSWLKKGLSR